MFASAKPRTGAPSSRPLKGFLIVAGTALLGTAVGVLALPDPGAARAAEPLAETAAARPAGMESLSPDITPVWIGLTILCLAAAATVALTRRARVLRDGNGSIHIVDTQLLGGRRMLHLVRVDGRKYLIGNSERGIHYLATLPQNALEEDVDELAHAAAADGEAPFANYLALSNRTR